MDGKDFRGYVSGEYGLPNDDSEELFMLPHPNAYHHHPQGTGAVPISPTLGGYGAMPPPRLQHSPPFDTNVQQYYMSMDSGNTVSAWSQGWPQDSTLLSSGSAIDCNISPILQQEHQQQQQQLQYHQQALLHHNKQYSPCQREQPPSLSNDHNNGPTHREASGVGGLQQLHHQSTASIKPTRSVQSCSNAQQLPSLECLPTTSAADNQYVPEPEEFSRSSSQSESSTATVDELSGDGVFLLLTNSNAQPSGTSDGQSGSIYVPSLDVFPGDYGFKVTFKNPDSSAYSYTPQTKVLCANKNVDFAAIFSFSERPRPGFNIRTLVCPKTSQDIQKVGIVKQCPTHFHKDNSSNHFLTCRSNKAVYGECHSHSIITVPLDTMTEYDLNGPTCVYSCACYSTCVVGKGANKPTLVIIFSLVDDTKGNIVGQDVINLRCCACPNRDSGRARKRGSNTSATNPAKKRKKHNKGCPESPPLPLTAAAAAVGSFPLPLLPPLSSLPTQLNRVKDVQPDEDGYYTFTWRVKDKAILNMLTLMKEGHSHYT